MGNLLVKFWDVNHGHATYIRSPNGRHIVIDLGNGELFGNEKFSPLLHLKNHYGVEQLDYCIITHPHLDHIDDILNLNKLSPKVLTRPNHIPERDLLNGVRLSELPKIKEYLRINKKYNREIINGSYDNPADPEFWGGLVITHFHPLECSTSNLNNQSIVTVLEYAKIKIVIPGDNEAPSWNELLRDCNFTKKVADADIYLASHHGRQSGYHQDVMKLINPRLTIVSDSKYHENSNIDRYRKYSRGWDVYKDNVEVRRFTLSTYNDGVITVNAGHNQNTGKSYLQVDI
ncbi:ComEC/Rec2 family competence protein [Bacillus salitolerans]|uniref:ComEC/Rec2 family competence protein n=1 Tax=Bacillus salitolerans TaxID=1437434 RepID=A0ABW4LJL5_9BACI